MSAGASNACGECGLTYADVSDFDAHIRQHDLASGGGGDGGATAAATPKAVCPKKRNRRHNSLTTKNNYTKQLSTEPKSKKSDEAYGSEGVTSLTTVLPTNNSDHSRVTVGDVAATVVDDALKLKGRPLLCADGIDNGGNSNGNRTSNTTYAAMLAAALNGAAAAPPAPGNSSGALLLAENLRRLLSGVGLFHGTAAAGDAALNLSADGVAPPMLTVNFSDHLPSTSAVGSRPASSDSQPPINFDAPAVSTSVSPTLSKSRKRGSGDCVSGVEVGRAGKVAKMALQCQFCNFSTFMSQHMKSHLEAHERHRGQMYQCDICLTEFSQKANMHRHRTRHSGIKPYECAFCDKEFYRKDQMQEHSMTHIKTGTNFDCPVQNCQEQFEQHPALRQHVEERHMAAAATASGGQKQVGCKRCSLLFASARRLILHYQTKHGDHLKYLIAKKAETKAALRLSASPHDGVSDEPADAEPTCALDLSSAERLAPPTAQRVGRKRHAVASGSASPFEALAGYRVDDLLSRPTTMLAGGGAAPPALFFSASSSPSASLSGSLAMRGTVEDRSNRSSPGGASLGDVGHALMNLTQTFPQLHHGQPADASAYLPRSKSPDYKNLFGGNYGSTASSVHNSTTSDELLMRLAGAQDGNGSFEVTRDDRPQLQFSVWSDPDETSGAPSAAATNTSSASSGAEALPLTSAAGGAERQAHSATHSPHSASSGSNHSTTVDRTAAAATAAALLLSVAYDAPTPMTSGDGAVALECLHCGILFRDPTLYLVHKGLHSADDAWRCNMCGFASADKYTFHAHVITADHKKAVFRG